MRIARGRCMAGMCNPTVRKRLRGGRGARLSIKFGKEAAKMAEKPLRVLVMIHRLMDNSPY